MKAMTSMNEYWTKEHLLKEIDRLSTLVAVQWKPAGLRGDSCLQAFLQQTLAYRKLQLGHR